MLDSTGTFAFGAEQFSTLISDKTNNSVSWDGAATFNINAATTNAWDVQLRHAISVQAGQRYAVCFSAYGEAGRTLIVDFDRGGSPDFTSLINGGEEVVISSSAENFKLVFDVTTDDESARLKFNLGGTPASITIDNIAVHEGEVCPSGDATPVMPSQAFAYEDAELMAKIKTKINQNDDYFTPKYQTLIGAANDRLGKTVDPVTNKTFVPETGDKRDYYSIGPYWWPNPNTRDGLPWIRKDGQVNPMTRNGDTTDQRRISAFFGDMHILGLAYYYSDDDRYANKAMEFLRAWYINPETRVNPNINFGQAVPGVSGGRPFGIIEWGGMDWVITTVQILKSKGKLSAAEITTFDQWVNDYLNWLQTSTIGIAEKNTKNNHGTWYDKQVLGLLLYLDKTTAAKNYANSVTKPRIAQQIQPDGRMPEELKRTKSVNYTSQNIRAFIEDAALARKAGIDLWAYQSSDGRSIKKSVEFVLPYLKGDKSWSWEQITGGGATSQLANMTRPFFAGASTRLGVALMPSNLMSDGYSKMSDIDLLTLPPLDRVQ